MSTPAPPEVDFEVKERAMDEAPVGITISDPDRPDNPLVYVNDAFEQLTGYPRDDVIGRNCRFLQGEDSDPDVVAELRAGIEAAEPVTVELVNYRQDGEPFWNEVTVAPLRNAQGDVTHFVGFQVDVTVRKEVQLALADERERLDRLVDRINGLLADVTERLMLGVDREATERAIVERIAATGAYEAAWIGEPDLASEVLRSSSWAGFAGDLDGHEVPVNGDDAVARAYRERAVVVDDAASDPVFGGLEIDGPVAAIPLAYGDATYGVLGVMGADSTAIDDRELVVLESVGRTIATAINAAQSRRGLTTDDLVELEFTVADEAFFPVALAEAWDCRLELRGASTAPAGGVRLFFEVLDAGPQEGDLPPVGGIEDVVYVHGGDTELVELDLAPGSLVDRLAERGAEVRSLTADAGVAELEVVLPAETGGRVVLELLEDRFEGVELVAYRERERRPTTRSALIAELESALTERQETALRSAYYSGYYDEPRTTTGDELAAAMGVTRPTFHQHLRAAERKLFAAVLE